MILSQTNLDLLAERIEQAYRRQHPNWIANGLTPGVWTAAAIRLNEVAARSVALPVDPELFVAVQGYKTFRRDPWRELTQEGSAKCYRAAVRQIVKQLRAELANELRWARRFLESGRPIEDLIKTAKARVSPIIKLVLCLHHERADLAELVRPAAEAQHLACPLYLPACRHLMPHSAYPNQRTSQVTVPGMTEQAHSFAWN